MDNASFEKLVNAIMKEAESDGEPLTYEEAKEVAELELKAKKVKRYEQSAEPRKKSEKSKVSKVSDEKKELFGQIITNLTSFYANNVTILKENKLISVKIGDKTFKVDIIEQRPPKK